MNRYYTIHLLKSAKFNDFLEIHRHLQPLPQSNLNTFSVPKGNSYLLGGARFPPQCSGARSLPQSLWLFSPDCLISVASHSVQSSVNGFLLTTFLRLILQYVNYMAVFTFSWTLYLHFLSVHYSLLQWACELQIKLWSPGSEKMVWFC